MRYMSANTADRGRGVAGVYYMVLQPGKPVEVNLSDSLKLSGYVHLHVSPRKRMMQVHSFHLSLRSCAQDSRLWPWTTLFSLSLWHLLYAQLFNSVSAHPSVNWFHGILVWSTIPTSQITGTICLISPVVLCHLLLPESWYNTLVGNLSTGKEHT